MASVRANYDVPAARGREVLLLLWGTPVRARIISSTGSHLYVRLTRNGRRVGPLHPCWKIDYLDGRGDRTGQPTPMDRAWAVA
jgi:hypothetical protein